MNTPDKVLKIAAAEVGYLEKSKAAYQADPKVLYDKTAGAGSDNYTKYGKEMHDIYPAVMDFPAAWCDCFVDWCFYMTYGVCTAKNMIGGNFDDYTVNSAQMYKNKGAWYTTPEIGDQIFFKNSTRICHTGIVEDVKDGRVYPIEGNTSDKSGLIPNGGCVARKIYALNDPCIAGYGRPSYDKVSRMTPVRPPEKYQWGMDVSQYQGAIDYDKVKEAGIGFVVIRAIKKNGSVDPYFERNYSECVSHRIDYSCYKLSYAVNQDQARAEANILINLIRNRKMMIWLDLEDECQLVLGKENLESVALAFITECNKAGFQCGIYCSLDWYKNQISDYLKQNFLFWLARTEKNDTGAYYESRKPTGKNIFGWQYTHNGRLPGIDGKVDLDVLLM